MLFLSSCGFDINIGDFGPGKKGNGKVVTEQRKTDGGFKAVSASEGLQVYVTQAENFNIEVEADENIIDLIATDIKDGKLRIHARENIGNATKKIHVSLPQIASLKASSGALLETENTIESSILQIDGSSGALLRIDLTSNTLEIDASSGANLEVSGDTERADIDVSSGGNINAKELRTTNCVADASSGGNVKLHVTKSLRAEASSGGNIAYSGDPTLEQKKSVSGSVHKY